jgi:hypothetical protein
LPLQTSGSPSRGIKEWLGAGARLLAKIWTSRRSHLAVDMGLAIATWQILSSRTKVAAIEQRVLARRARATFPRARPETGGEAAEASLEVATLLARHRAPPFSVGRPKPKHSRLTSPYHMCTGG